MTVDGETAYCIDINTDFQSGYKSRSDASTRMSADQIADVALSLEYVKQYAASYRELNYKQVYLLEQCVAWLSDLAQGIYPLVCHKNLSQERREAIIDTCTRSDYIIPEKANFGVLTSGTTGTPKILWRSEQSWADFFDEQNKVFHIDKDTDQCK